MTLQLWTVSRTRSANANNEQKNGLLSNQTISISKCHSRVCHVFARVKIKNTVNLIETRCMNNVCFEIELQISNLLRSFYKYLL